jgi:hypothetical protein
LCHRLIDVVIAQDVAPHLFAASVPIVGHRK